MLSRSTIGILGVSLAIAAAGPVLTAGGDSRPQVDSSVDAVLKAYRGGDFDVVAKSFTKSTDFVEKLRINEPRDLERWLGDWDRTKAVFVIELAHVAISRGAQFMTGLTRAGRRYLLKAQADAKTTTDAATVDVLWNRIAVGLLMGLDNPLLVEEHIDALALAAKESKRPLDSRLVLARAIAKETICWKSRPTADYPGAELVALTDATGVRIENNLDAPRQAVRRKHVETHRACLRDAAVRFEAAEAHEDTRVEAVARGAWVLYLEGRAREAADKLAAAKPPDDRVVAYWMALFQGRALSALRRTEQSLDAYTRALALFPGAQSASIGRALELSHLRRLEELDAMSQKVRATAAPDPWLDYFSADYRFVDRWLYELRAVIK